MIQAFGAATLDVRKEVVESAFGKLLSSSLLDVIIALLYRHAKMVKIMFLLF